MKYRQHIRHALWCSLQDLRSLHDVFSLALAGDLSGGKQVEIKHLFVTVREALEEAERLEVQV